MNIIEKLTVRRFHEEKLRSCQEDLAIAQGWKDGESQRKRFEILLSACDLTCSKVLDVGCGTGDLKPFIDNIYKEVSYLGIDLNEQFINLANARYGQFPETRFIVADLAQSALPEVDFVLASGALSYRSSDPEYYHKMIGKMYEAADRALVFNMLDQSKTTPDSLLVAHNPDEVVAFCQSICDDVQLLQKSLPDGFTICMRKV